MISKDNKITADLQVKQLEILKELDRVCKICGVKYFLSTGSCLGAVRHQGFIPWDDDIDVILMWTEAEKLIENRNLFAPKYFLQCQKTEPNFRNTCLKLRDSETSYFEKDEVGLDINHGIGIDIYILYPYSDNFMRAHKVIFDSFIYRILCGGVAPQNHGKLPKLIGEIILNIYSGNGRQQKINKILREYKYNGGNNYVATYFGEDVTPFKSIIYPKYLFEEQTWMNFEDMIVPCPKDPKEYCRIRYGENYMQLPPESKRVSKHDYVYASIKNSFMKFKGVYY